MSSDEPTYTYPLPRADTTQPPAEYEMFRKMCPVMHVNLPTGHKAYLATRHEDVKTVLGDPRFSRAAFLEPGVPRLQPIKPHPDDITSMDPPRLTRVRRPAARGRAAGAAPASVRRAGGPAGAAGHIVTDVRKQTRVMARRRVLKVKQLPAEVSP